ncbi:MULTISPECIES: hypothetical protein [Cobetia]|uniref:hypothetical protein n=1 Tax=Cobetia TaxID=204286 RepID=UPI0022FF3917|nr:hypothetical protein [Cobetia sp. MMG027]MDA5564104.1 hypothetical protein [Cobetia sp. MMG027]
MPAQSSFLHLVGSCFSLQNPVCHLWVHVFLHCFQLVIVVDVLVCFILARSMHYQVILFMAGIHWLTMRKKTDNERPEQTTLTPTATEPPAPSENYHG